MDLPAMPDDPWVKVVDMLQHNWATMDARMPEGVRVLFFHDGGGVFDEMTFGTEAEAAHALRRNGFSRWSADPELRAFVALPAEPLHRDSHQNGRIYSSGRFWKP